MTADATCRISVTSSRTSRRPQLPVGQGSCVTRLPIADGNQFAGSQRERADTHPPAAASIKPLDGQQQRGTHDVPAVEVQAPPVATGATFPQGSSRLAVHS